MKTVFTNEMVQHVWAQQSQYEGRNGNGSHSFRGTTLYSYSTPIANFVECATRRGMRHVMACLITTESYSITTSAKHMPRSADIPSGIPVFYVKHVGVEAGQSPRLPSGTTLHRANLDDMIETYSAALNRFARGFSTEWPLQQLNRIREQAQSYCHTFKLRFPAAKFAPPSDALIDKIKEREAVKEARLIAKAQHEAAEREAMRLQRVIDANRAFDKLINGHSIAFESFHFEHLSKDQAQAAWVKLVQLWQSCEIRNLPQYKGDDFYKVLLRAHNGNLETSRGATVPLDHAIKVFQFAKLCKQAGKEWQRNGVTVRVGQFQVDKISAAGDIKAGCHFIEWIEIERLAQSLGIFDTAPSDAVLVKSNHALSA